MIFTDFVDIMDRAARNGTKAHLPADIVRAAIRHPAFVQYQAERLKEIASTWDDEPPKPEGPSSGHSGSGTGPTETTGVSVGTLTGPMAEAVERAERARAWEAVKPTGHPRKRP